MNPIMELTAAGHGIQSAQQNFPVVTGAIRGSIVIEIGDF
jgi:hypothetical protein